MVESREVGVVLDGVERRVVALVALIFPYMDCQVVNHKLFHAMKKRASARTESITVAHFSPPTSNQMYVVLWCTGDLRIPMSYQIDVFIHLVRFDSVHHDTVHILPSRQHLTKALLDVMVHLLSFMRAIDQVA